MGSGGRSPLLLLETSVVERPKLVLMTVYFSAAVEQSRIALIVATVWWFRQQNAVVLNLLECSKVVCYINI